MNYRLKANYYLWLVLIWLLAAWLVNPLGDFPLNDDWAYARPVQSILESGRYRVPDGAGMTLWLHAWLGAGVAKLFGFFYTVLRIWNLLLALLGLLVFGRLAQGITERCGLVVLTVLLLAFNPLYFSLSFTFMTEISFLLFLLLTIAAYGRIAREDQWRHWLLALAFTLAALLVRQLAWLPAPAFGLALLWQRFSWRRLLFVFTIMAAGYSAIHIYSTWLASVQEVPPNFGRIGDVVRQLEGWRLLSHAWQRSGHYLFQWGLFLLPLTVAVLPVWLTRVQHRSDETSVGWGRKASQVGLLTLAIALALGGSLAWRVWDEIPQGNLFFNLGLAPIVLKDVDLGFSQWPALPGWAWSVVKFVGLSGGVLLLWLLQLVVLHLWRRRKLRASVDVVKIGLLLFCGSYYLYLLLDWAQFDRYSFILLPPLALLLLPYGQSFQTTWLRLAYLLLLPYTFFSLTATHDYLAFNRARWELIDGLEKEGITSARIDGGLEYNGWRQSAPRNGMTRNTDGRRCGKSWWYVEGDQYVISLGALPCYQAREARGFNRWLNFRRDSVWVLERPAWSSVDAFHWSVNSAAAGDSLLYDRHRNHPAQLGGKVIGEETSGGKDAALELTDSLPFGLTTLLAVRPCDQLTLTVWRRGEAGLVVSSESGTEFYCHEAAFVDSLSGDWQRPRLNVTIPADFQGSRLKIYVWQWGQGPSWVNDLSIVHFHNN